MMLELSPFRKNKINLEDYDYKNDIQNRVFLSSLSPQKLQVLEEILYSPLTISAEKLCQNLEITEEELAEILAELEQTGLFKIKDSVIYVDKEMRKYYERQMVKFESNFFIPNLDFLQGLLKKVPIHILPTWYHIPRTTNNIFDSLVEKYFLTPQIFHRYLKELNLGDQILTSIVEDVFSSPDFKIPSREIKEKYNLSKEVFEECMLHLEFNFVCCLGYEKNGNSWQEFVTPFQEWREYLLFLRNTTPKPIDDPENVKHDEPYAFISALTDFLAQISEGKTAKGKLLQKLEGFYLVKGGKITPCGKEWLTLSLEDRALYLYRHPNNQMISSAYEHIATEKNIREIEKSLHRVVDLGWVYFDDFIQGILIPLSEKTAVVLKKIGRRWKYNLPEYTDEEIQLIKTTILDGLYESGMIVKGLHNGKECFTVTELGKSLFSQ